MMVGISIKDLPGSKAALCKAISLAGSEDQVGAIHVPKVMPELLFSSMSDPSDADEETMDFMANMPEAAGKNLQQQIKEAAEAEMKQLGKDVKISYQMLPSTRNCKGALLNACNKSGANFLFIGPGISGEGSFPSYAIQHAKGFTVCVIRDHIE